MFGAHCCFLNFHPLVGIYWVLFRVGVFVLVFARDVFGTTVACARFGVGEVGWVVWGVFASGFKELARENADADAVRERRD